MAAMSAQLRCRDVLIENLKLQLASLKRMNFGRSSEQLDAQIAQLEFSLGARGQRRRGPRAASAPREQVGFQARPQALTGSSASRAPRT
jgi:hypothetical protein